jgi:hypothetical protein
LGEGVCGQACAIHLALYTWCWRAEAWLIACCLGGWPQAEFAAVLHLGLGKFELRVGWLRLRFCLRAAAHMRERMRLPLFLRLEQDYR